MRTLKKNNMTHYCCELGGRFPATRCKIIGVCILYIVHSHSLTSSPRTLFTDTIERIKANKLLKKGGKKKQVKWGKKEKVRKQKQKKRMGRELGGNIIINKLQNFFFWFTSLSQ
eukprot:TRINITY_DN52_c1_g2_i1.p1 TRINITY_DN52_c1_g2~~TRINITY_DN52_c1_g2_i1.p1  ORF type:complete len:114 (-),score=4.69 TRINITY_DN52_c1_g2_i1:315-656(-)